MSELESLKKDNRRKHSKHKNLNHNNVPVPLLQSSTSKLPVTSNSEVLKISEPKIDPDAKFSKRKLVSNREKYEVEIEDEENEQMLAANFSNIIEMNKNVGGHFQFSSEKKWETELEEINSPFQDNFSLNISLLVDGISTIPFYKRHGYDISLFTVQNLKDMEREALTNAKRYKKIAEEQVAKTNKLIIKQPEHVVKFKDESSKNSKIDLQMLQKKMESNILDEIDVDDQKVSADNLPESVYDDSKEDIQKWLDDVLND